MEGESVFVKSVQELLKKGHTVDALNMFLDIENSVSVKTSSWDLIPVITEFLTSYCESDNEEVFKCCEQLINIIADQSNPEEALLQLIEEIEECQDDTKFKTLLKPMQIILVRIPKKRLISYAWGFNAIQSFLSKCEIPKSRRLFGKEKLLLDGDERTVRICSLSEKALFFYKDLEFYSNSENTEGRLEIVRKFLIRLLSKPLVYLDMEVFNGIKSKARLLGESIVNEVFKITSDPIALLELRFAPENIELFTLNSLGIAALFYLVYSEFVSAEKVPKVYHSVYFFQKSLHLVTILLDEDQQIVVEKGLKLATALLEHVKFSRLSFSLLDSEDHSKFCKSLAKVIIYNDCDFVRKSALEVYKTYLSSFEIRGFYLLVYNLMSALNHTGLISFTITQFKDRLANEFLSNENNFSVYLKGQKLMALLIKFCYLHKGEESDLIELFDQVMASLNLLRYLALRDKHNTTKIWDYVGLLEESYLKPLRRCIELSRAHYRLKIKEIGEEVEDRVNTDKDVSVTVANQNLSEMSKQEKLDVLNSSLTAFDVIDSLLSRLIECIEAYKR